MIFSLWLVLWIRWLYLLGSIDNFHARFGVHFETIHDVFHLLLFPLLLRNSPFLNALWFLKNVPIKGNHYYNYSRDMEGQGWLQL